MYAAMIRLPIQSDLSCRTSSICVQSKRRYYKNYVDEVLEMLQIGHVQHSIVGSVEKRGISGGQRKRVNIGLELVADPDVLFLDEPTSGLDSTSAEIILAALKDLSRLGRTIIMVIHQPRYSIFASMDNVIFLGPGGKTVYSGSPLDATDYFEMLGFHAPPDVNRADYFMDVIGGTISRANDPNFQPSDCFDLWKDWVEYSNSPSFQLVDSKKSDEDDVDDGYAVSQDSCTYRPKELQVIKQLFVATLAQCRARSSTALTTSEELKTFLLMVSEASVAEKISTRQALALGLVVRAAYYGDQKNLRIASDKDMMNNVETRANDMLKGRSSSAAANSSKGASSKTSPSGTSVRDHLRTASSMKRSDMSHLQALPGLEMTPISKKGKATGLKGDVESGSPVADLGSFGVEGILEWSDLAFMLNHADVMANILKIRSLEVIGADVEAFAKQDKSDELDQGDKKLVRRVFGWDHKLAQLCLFMVRYIQKRERGKKDL